MIKTAANHTTLLDYDIMGRPITTTLPDATVKHTAYHPTGQIKATWGSQTYPTWNIYDEQSRMTQLHTWKTAPALDPTNIHLPTTITPPAGSDVTTWIYGPTTGRLDRKQYADEKGTDYTYTDAGRLESRGWARGITTTYGYTHGMMTSTSYSDTTPDVTITYEPLGRQETVTQTNQSQITYTYDPANLALDTETIKYDLDHDGTYEFTRVLDRSRDSLQRDTGWQLKETASSTTFENEVTYGYSTTTGRLETVANAADTFTYGYAYNQTTANDPRVGSTTGTKQDLMPYTLTKSGSPVLQTLRTYEAHRDVLAAIQNKAGATTRSAYDYSSVNGGVNNLGQRKGVRTTFDLGTGITANPGDTSWGYDDLGQVTTAAAPGTAADRYFAYDAIGNRLASRSETATNSGGTLTEYFGKLTPTPVAGANAINQYAGIKKGAATIEPGYDDDGNATAYPVLPPGSSSLESSVLTWDAENRLVSTTANSVTTTHLYDAQSRKFATITSGTTTLYLYDGWNCIAEYTGTTLTKTRTWGLDLSGTMQGAGGVGGLLAEKQGSDYFYPTYDGNGNISVYLAADGSTAAHFEYDPFGNTVVNTDATNQFAYRFSTKPLDQTTGFYYYGYRWYDPVTGRWPSRDPIDEQGGLNLYVYVGNDGLNQIDFIGLASIRDPSGKIQEKDPNNPLCKCFRPYFQFVPDLFGGAHTAQLSWKNIVPFLGEESPKRHFDKNKMDPRGSRNGLVVFGLERVDTEECKDTQCQYITAGYSEYSGQPRTDNITQVGHRYSGETFRDGNLSPSRLNEIIIPTVYVHLNKDGFYIKWNAGLQGYINAYDKRGNELVLICTKTFNWINPTIRVQ